ncbi:MAG: HD domain-containing protein [Promethearchaeota archaeon]
MVKQDAVDGVVAEINREWQENFPLGEVYPRKGKKINDPLYQTIHVEPAIRFLVDLPPVQRLRYIHHLGLTYFVYPTANHTRFDHSLGVYYVLSRFLDNFEKSRDELYGGTEKLHDFPEGGLNHDLTLQLKIAALFHDIGHLPFSHCGEACFAGLEIPELGTREYQTKAVHEYFTCKLVETPYVQQALELVERNEGVEIDTEFLKSCITGDATHVSDDLRWAVQLVNGDLDADKIDYLVRDSHFTGVPYGTIDLSRIVLMFRVKRVNGSLSLFGNKRGLTAFESLFLARLFMFSSVYHHHAKVAAEQAFSRLIADHFSRDGSNLFDLLGMNDFQLCGALDGSPSSRGRFRRLFNRKLPKLVLELSGSTMKDRGWEPPKALVECRALERELESRLVAKGLVPRSGGGEPAITLYFSESKTAAAKFQLYLDGGQTALISKYSNLIEGTTGLQKVGFAFSKSEVKIDQARKLEISREIEQLLDEKARF